MKILLLIAVFAAGVGIGLALSKPLFSGAPKKAAESRATDSRPVVPNWPDSLDAVTAAPKSHRIIFENADVRILEVVLGPYENEPMHTHRLPSVMFGNRLNAHGAFSIVYYRYAYDANHRRYIVTDSSEQHATAAQAGAIESGHFMKPEQPHSIRNLSNVTIDAYRVELKNAHSTID